MLETIYSFYAIDEYALNEIKKYIANDASENEVVIFLKTETDFIGQYNKEDYDSIIYHLGLSDELTEKFDNLFIDLVNLKEIYDSIIVKSNQIQQFKHMLYKAIGDKKSLIIWETEVEKQKKHIWKFWEK